MALEMGPESEKLFNGLVAHLEQLRVVASQNHQDGVVSAIDNLKDALMRFKGELDKGTDQLKGKIKSQVEEISRDDPWSIITSHRKR